jgi:glycosyltransferase involved in cell wall biosynthesis
VTDPGDKVRRQTSPEEPAPLFSVIVPAFNEENYLPGCLAAVRRAEKSLGQPVEIVVVDNNSTDKTAEIALRLGAKVVGVREKCLSIIRNRGAEAAKGRYLAFIDADSVMSDNMLVEVAKVMHSGRYIGGGVANVRPDRLSIGLFFSGLAFLPFVLWYIRAACIMFYTARETFQALGGFDERLVSVEDVDFARRLKRFGKGQGLRYKNLLRGRVTTSTRKFSEFGDWFVVRHPIKVYRMFHNDRTVAEDYWYRPRR